MPIALASSTTASLRLSKRCSDSDSVKVGYEVSFTRHFYQPPQLRTLAEISADILALEQETEDLLNEITKGASP